MLSCMYLDVGVTLLVTRRQTNGTRVSDNVQSAVPSNCQTLNQLISSFTITSGVCNSIVVRKHHSKPQLSVCWLEFILYGLVGLLLLLEKPIFVVLFIILLSLARYVGDCEFIFVIMVKQYLLNFIIYQLFWWKNFIISVLPNVKSVIHFDYIHNISLIRNKSVPLVLWFTGYALPHHFESFLCHSSVFMVILLEFCLLYFLRTGASSVFSLTITGPIFHHNFQQILILMGYC